MYNLPLFFIIISEICRLVPSSVTTKNIFNIKIDILEKNRENIIHIIILGPLFLRQQPNLTINTVNTENIKFDFVSFPIKRMWAKSSEHN